MNRLDGFYFNTQWNRASVTRPLRNRGGKGNGEINSVASVDSCSFNPHDILNVLSTPFGASMIGGRMGKLP